jgi:hypothetical protein
MPCEKVMANFFVDLRHVRNNGIFTRPFSDRRIAPAERWVSGDQTSAFQRTAHRRCMGRGEVQLVHVSAEGGTKMLYNMVYSGRCTSTSRAYDTRRNERGRVW